MNYKIAAMLCALFLATGCSDDDTDAPANAGPDAGVVEDLELQASDFSCILDWPQVGHLRVLNPLGHQAEAEAVAADPNGGTYPVGTILQVFAVEAMVKRRPGFDPSSNDWEFFALAVDEQGTTITARGGADIVNPDPNINPDGLTCRDCHQEAEAKFDLVCHTDHGCEPFPLTEAEILAIQASDPRCAL